MSILAQPRAGECGAGHPERLHVHEGGLLDVTARQLDPSARCLGAAAQPDGTSTSAAPHQRLAERREAWQDERMAPDTLTDLLRLPSGERADLAMALWASLDDAQRGAELALTRAQAAEFDRRLEEHRADPSSALPWEDVRRKLLNRP